ncbi:cold-shock protein [Salinibaculum rarum]|uniref:cold-shock protein n=1 Tax=Salinibaculum rarum TaxID=3058903 RepID=UPI00265DDCCD|nr:cold shock domain-containing protein [Salinibaculum sp. KK48]
MAHGEVTHFDEEGGYGFIETEDVDEDVFFHMTDIGGPDLEEGREVDFEYEDGDKGPRVTELDRL